MRICMTFHEEAEKRLTADHERVMGIASVLKSFGHDVYLIEGALDNRCFNYKGTKILHVNKAFTRQLRLKVAKLTSIIDRITQIQGILSKLSYLLLDEPFVTLKTREVMTGSDIIIAIGDLTIAPVILAKMLKKKVVLDIQGLHLQAVYKMRGDVPLYSYYGRLIFHTLLGKLNYHLADKVLVPSYDELRYLIRMFGLPRNKVFVIPNVVDISILKPDVKKREKVRNILGVNAYETVILFMGGHTGLGNELAVKYITRVLAPSIRTKCDNVFFVITGSWAAYKGGSDVIFAGYVDDVVGYINAADICIAPLTVGSGTKVKMLAYMACEKPIVATPVAAEGINVLHGEQALIYEISNFPDGVLYAIENRTNLIDLGKNARTHIEKRYSWNRITKDINRLMYALTKEP